MEGEKDGGGKGDVGEEGEERAGEAEEEDNSETYSLSVLFYIVVIEL